MSGVCDQVTEQRLNALQSANQVRMARAAIRRHLRSAPSRAVSWARLADMIDEGFTDECRDMAVGDLLMACARTGGSGSGKVLAFAGLAPYRQVGSLRPPEARRLSEILRAGSIDRARGVA